MNLFFGEINETEIKLDEMETHHLIKVLRKKSGDEIWVTDGKGQLAKGKINTISKSLNLPIIEKKSLEKKSGKTVRIYIAPTKNLDRFEFFVEKAVELGVSEITPILTKNSERKHLNLEKLEKQIIAACKQSLRLYFPTINPLTPISKIIPTLNPENSFVAHCDETIERVDLKDIKVKDVNILIGPEGDFSQEEIKLLNQHDIKGLNLGRNRLRTETAGIYVMAKLSE